MKKRFRVLCIGLLVIVCAIGLLLCACGDPDSNTENPNPGIVTPPKPDDDTPKPDDDTPKPDDDTPKPDEKKTFTVTFDMNGYGIAIASKSAKEGETIEAPEAPSALFMTFGGWYKNAECTEAFDFGAPLTANVTAYAKWTPSEKMPETGYSPDAPKSIILDGVSVSDDIASGTTLYYTFTATDAGRYGFSIASNGDVTKLNYVYTASSSTAEELKENAGLVNGEYNFYLTLAAEETVSISVAVKNGETISAENPSDARVSVFTATDEPIPDGMFLEGLYTGNYAGYMTIYFRIKDRVNKIFTMDVDSEGTTEGIFTYLNGVVTIAQNQCDWGTLGFGTMTWEASEDEDEPAIINFVGGKTSIGSVGKVALMQEIAAIRLAHENWIGEYEATKENASISAVRIGKKYVQVVKSDGTVSAYFTEISSTYNNYAKFTDTEISCGSVGSIVIRKENEGHAEKIRVTIGGTSESLVLKTNQVVEIPFMLPLVKGATYIGTATVEEEVKTYSLMPSGVFWVLSGLADDAYPVEMLDFDGVSTYSVKVTTKTKTGYYKFKLVRKEGKLAAELYEGDTLIVTLTTNAADVSENTYVLKDGENTGSLNAETGYAYITVEETKSYIFTGNVKIYNGVNVLYPGNVGAWTELPLGEMLDLDEGSVLAVKPTGDGSSFTFSAQFKPLRGTSEDNPIEIESTYSFKAQKDITYFLKFVAPADGEFEFSSSNAYNYVGFCIEDEWYANTADGVTVLDKHNSVKKTLAAGDTLIIKVANNSYKNSSAVSFTLTVAVTYDFTESTALTLDEDISGKVSATGVYNAELTTVGVIGLEFNAAEPVKIVLSGGTVKNGKAVTLNKTELINGFRLVCSGEVSYTAVWDSGYAKNPYKLTMGGTGSASYYWRDVEGDGTHFTFTAPKAETYTFRFATDGAQYFIYDGNQYDALTLELSEGQTIAFRANKESSVTGETFSLLLGYDYFANLTEISFAADQSETALTAGNHKVTEGTLADSTQITFTSQSSFKIMFANGNEAESTQADDVHTITVPVSQMTADTVFRLEADSSVSWKVAYTLGTVRNPVQLSMNAQTNVSQDSDTVTMYATVTAPEYSALSISLSSIPAVRGNYYAQFKIVGDASGTIYGYKSLTATTAAAGGLVYKLAKGETVTLELTYRSASSWFSKYPVNVYYSFADDNTTALDWTAESKALSASNYKIYRNAHPEIASVKLTADKAFAVYSSASATGTPTRTEATLTDGVYSITVSNRYFFLDYGENDSVAYAIGSYAVGSSQNPMLVTKLGDTNVSYTSAYADGKYYVTVTVAEAGNYVLGVAEGYTLTGDGLTDGVVAFTAEALTKTFTVISGSYTADGDTITATVALSVNKKLETQTLTFNSAEGLEGAGTLALESNSAYIVGAVVVTEALDKYISSIVFTSSAAFSISYPDDTVATATAKDEVYTLTVTVANARKGFALSAEGTVTYAIAWTAGSQLNPVGLGSLTSGNSISYRLENIAYVKVTNGSQFDWLVSFTGTNLTADIVSGATATEDGILVAAGSTAVIMLTNSTANATRVTATAVIVYSFKASATELAFDVDGNGTTTIASGNIYKHSNLSQDAECVVFKSESTLKITYINGTTAEGNQIKVSAGDLANGLYIVCDGEITYETVWYIGSSKNPFSETMKGTWTYKGATKDSWNWDNIVNVTITIGDNSSVTYVIANTTYTLHFKQQDDGSMTATYAYGSNTRTVTIWLEDGVLKFEDSYEAVGKYTMTKQEAEQAA